MSGQLEWFICFMFGCAMAWGTLKLFGLIDLLIAFSALGLTPCAPAQTYGTLAINNIGNPAPISLSVFADGPCYAPLTYSGCSGGANAAGDFYTLETATVAANSLVFLTSETSAQSGINVVQAQELAQSFGPWTGQSTCTIDVSSTNYATLHWRPSADNPAGGFFQECPPGTAISITSNTNTPWVPEGTNTATTVATNYNTGGSYGKTIDALNPRDLTAFSEVQTQAQQLSAALNYESTNLWAQSSLNLNLGNITNVGSATVWNPWLIGAGIGIGTGMTNTGAINYDPHQWNLYSPLSAWVRALWLWIILYESIILIHEWLIEVIDLMFTIPGFGTFKSSGGFIFSFLCSSVFWTALMAFPIAFLAYDQTLNAFSGTSPYPSLTSFFQEDGSQLGLLMRAGWTLLNEWFPINDAFTIALYLLFLRYLAIPAIKGVSAVTIKFLTCAAICALISSAHAAANALFSQSVPGAHRFHYNSSFAIVDDGTALANVQYNFIPDGSDGEAYLIFGLVADVNAWAAGSPMGGGILELFTTGSQTTYNGVAAPFFTDDVFPGPVFPYTGLLFEGDIPTTGFRPGSLAQFIYPFRTNYVSTTTTINHAPFIAPFLATVTIANASSGSMWLLSSTMNGTIPSGGNSVWPAGPTDTNLAIGPNGSLAWTNSPGHNYVVGCGTNGIPAIEDDPDGKLAVDGVQAFIEGYGMIIPMAAMAWLRKFRKWGQSAGQRLDL